MGEEPDRAEATVSFGQEDDDDDSDQSGPDAKPLALVHESHPLQEHVVWEPEQGSRVHSVPSEPRADSEGRKGAFEPLQRHGRQLLHFVGPVEGIGLTANRPLPAPRFAFGVGRVLHGER